MNIKYIIIALVIGIPLISEAQKNKQKLPKDSIIYYQKQLRDLWKKNNDSLINSEKYKEIFQKLNPEGLKEKDDFGVELTFITGFQINNYNHLNNRLKSLGIKKVKSSVLPIGIGLSIRFKNIIFGTDMSAISGENTSGAYANVYISTNILETKRWIFSPQIGIGSQIVTLRIPTQSSSNDFNSYFTTSSNQVEIVNKNTMLDFAMAFKLLSKHRDLYAPLFRVGYRYGLKEKSWEIKNGVSTNAPIDRVNNFYIHLRVGFGN